MNTIDLAERGLLPDAVIRHGIRRLLARRLRSLPGAAGAESLASFAARLAEGPLAIETDAANRQHYEAPPEFFEHVLGPRLKYSCCLFADPDTTLPAAEEAMLSLTCARAEVEDGMRVLELGCGWGSLTLWMAEQFPPARITAVSNSQSQRLFIQRRAKERGLANVEVITADMRAFNAPGRYDRVVSVEMFEHMRNYALLFERVRGWLASDGKAFVHVFCHRDTPYLFETEGRDDWMGRHFFTGGTMPSERLFGCFDEHLCIARQWRVNGLHYWRTCEAWLANLDRAGDDVLRLFRQTLPPGEARLMRQRWRMFFMACAELFRCLGGEEWFVAHYLFEPAASHSRRASAAARGEL